MEKVLITGATGFIGGNLVKGNLAKGNRVRALALTGDPGAVSLKTQGVEVAEGDVRDFASVKKAVDGMEIVFHCAAVVTDWAPKRLFREVTVDGAENMCRAAGEAGVSRFVDISTCDVFGIDEDHVMDESFPLRPWKEPYPDYKIKSEEIMWRYHREKGLPVTMVYPCWVFGEGDQTFVPLLADAIIKKELIFWRRDALVWPTYIENLVDLLLLISEDPRAVGNGYLVHDGECTTLQEFCTEIARAMGVPPATTHIPYGLAYAASWIMELLWKMLRIQKRPLLTTYTVKNLGSRFHFSIDKARRELGWTPKIPYREGMAVTMKWLKTLDLTALKQK
ncbi:MAG: NAD-dependent epimerase/dehydratase family protein [Deltaproteobacteria bacterium]|nr:NAD-dependent epimerase/dehydratase family protein [Deltaproteobacteria bacterium]